VTNAGPLERPVGGEGGCRPTADDGASVQSPDDRAPRIGESANAATVRETAPRTTGTADRPTSRSAVRRAFASPTTNGDPPSIRAFTSPTGASGKAVASPTTVTPSPGRRTRWRYRRSGSSPMVSGPSVHPISDSSTASTASVNRRTRSVGGLVGRDPMSSSTPNAKSAAAGRDANADAVDDDAKRNPASPESIETHERPFPWLRYSDTSYAQQRHCSSENGAGSVSASSLSSSDLPCAPDAISARPVTRTRRSPACSDRGSVAVARATRSASREPRPPRARNPRLTSSAATPIRVGRIDRSSPGAESGGQRASSGGTCVNRVSNGGGKACRLRSRSVTAR